MCRPIYMQAILTEYFVAIIFILLDFSDLSVIIDISGSIITYYST